MLDPLLQQVAFRFRRDDGSETGASWIEAENVNVAAAIEVASIFRLRVSVEEVNGSSAANSTFWIQANLNGGSFVTLTEVDQGIGFDLQPSAFVADETPTTKQLTAGASFSSGYVVTSNPTVTTSVLGSRVTEWEYCVQIDPASYNNGDVFQFRVVLDGDVLLGSYVVTPQITLIKPNYVDFSGGAVASASAQGGVKMDRGFVADPMVATAQAAGDVKIDREFSASILASALASGDFYIIPPKSGRVTIGMFGN
jgi:hypothetical protein